VGLDHVHRVGGLGGLLQCAVGALGELLQGLRMLRQLADDAPGDVVVGLGGRRRLVQRRVEEIHVGLQWRLAERLGGRGALGDIDAFDFHAALQEDWPQPVEAPNSCAMMLKAAVEAPRLREMSFGSNAPPNSPPVLEEPLPTVAKLAISAPMLPMAFSNSAVSSAFR